MKSCYHYAFGRWDTGGINACSRASFDYPLTVNCTGRRFADEPFATDNTSGREDYYLMYIENGKLELWREGRFVTAAAGNIVIFPPRHHYRYRFDGKEPLSYLWVHFTGSYAARFLAECGLDPLPCYYPTEINSKIVSYFTRMFDIFESGDILRSQRISSSLEQLLLTVAMSVRADQQGRTLERSLEFIHSSYDREIKIPQLAKMEFLSNSRYISVFKERFGMSPSEYIINLRMNVACQLLKSTDMTVKQIAAAVGYSDPHFFSKLFKKKTGASPREYRL